MPEFSTEKILGEGRRTLDVDVFRPIGQANGVAVILIHGGGWVGGHRSMVYNYAKALAGRGFVAVAAEYRLLGEALWPAQLDDIRDIIRWTKANANELAIDPTKIALQGFSAGAHLALLVGGTQPGSGREKLIGVNAEGTSVAAIVSFFAPVRLDANPAVLSRPPFSILLNGGGVEAARAASPIYYIHQAFPSTFILGGMADYMQPIQSGLDLLQAFVDVGAEVEFHYMHSQVHEFASIPSMLPEMMAEVAFFYRRTLLNRDALAKEARDLNIFARAADPEEFARLIASR